MSAPSRLEASALKVALDTETGAVQAIDDLTLAIERGETFALVGESGCGKSMTALALLRLLPDNGAITAGEVSVGGTDVLALPESRMRAVRGGRIGMIFQEPSTSLNPVMRVGDQIVEAIRAHERIGRKAARERAIEWLRAVGIPEPERRIDDYPFRMSGGQKQRVMIALALAAEPDFLVADEPTTALDVTIQKQILDLLVELQRAKGMGMLLITHDLAVVSGLAHKVALMYAGQIVELATAADFFAAPAHPYARALLRALPDAGRRGEPLEAIPGMVPRLDRPFSGCRFAPRCAIAQSRCGDEAPALREWNGRQVRCHRVEESPAVTGPAPPAAIDAPPLPSPIDALPDTHTSALLRVEDLRVRFPLRRSAFGRPTAFYDAVAGVSFDVSAGRTLALVGESGCGKTTIGKAIVQLLRQAAAVEGKALLDGRDLFALHGPALRAARRDAQIIFQDPFASLDPRMRIAEILEEGVAALQPEVDAGERRRRVREVVERVGMRPDALARFPHEFSGGQRQRIAIARALALQPRLIVCDEPTSALDVSVQAQILNLLRELQRELGVAYLFITHNIGVVEYIADTVAVMRAGRFVEQGSARDVLGRPGHEYTRALLAAVPRLALA